MTKKSGLGTSGLSALFGRDVVSKVNKAQENIDNENSSNVNAQTSHTEVANAGEPLFVSIGLIQPNNKQPRKVFDEEALNELSLSIKEYGIIEPIIVKKISNSLYEIVAGERRWRAAKKAGLTKVPVVIKDLDEKISSEITLIENIQREDLNIVEEALAFQDLIEKYNYTQEELANRISKNRSTIANTMRVLKLDKSILDLVRQNKISAGHAKALIPVEDQLAAKEIAKFVVEKNLTVRETEQTVREYLKRISPNYKSPKSNNPLIKSIEKQLSESLGTKVSIVQNSNKKGKILIEFYNDTDLDNLYRLLKNK